MLRLTGHRRSTEPDAEHPEAADGPRGAGGRAADERAAEELSSLRRMVRRSAEGGAGGQKVAREGR
eukprot:5023093-Prymnesium_polylepis.1